MISRTGIFVLLGACIIAGMLIAGCTQPQTTTAVTTTTTVVPVATSAAETPAVATTASPAVSATAAETKEATPATGIANPASVNCGTLGGKTEIKTAADGGQYGMCAFANGTSCEEWALFRGEGCKPYTAPTAAATTAAVTETTAAVTATASK
jgi:putative hemolysin